MVPHSRHVFHEFVATGCKFYDKLIGGNDDDHFKVYGSIVFGIEVIFVHDFFWDHL